MSWHTHARSVAVAAALGGLFAVSCGGSQAPAATERPQAPSAAPTTNPASTRALSIEEEAPAGPQPPPKDELIKFANWDDNPVKLVNWIAAYLVAHGLDRPIRIIDVEDGAYQEPLLVNDVDIVIAADGAWADEQSGASVVKLGVASPIDPSLAVVVHGSMRQRAPDIVELMEKLRIDGDLLDQQAAMIRGGRVGLKENGVGLIFLKRHADVWTAWVDADTAALVAQAVEDGKIGHCRRFINYAPDQVGNEGSRYCKDDPTKTSGNR